MDPIKDMLDSSRFQKPDEIATIKKYIQDTYKVRVEVLVRTSDIVISTNSAALANTLRMESVHIQELCKTDKKLLFRIS